MGTTMWDRSHIRMLTNELLPQGAVPILFPPDELQRLKRPK